MRDLTLPTPSERRELVFAALTRGPATCRDLASRLDLSVSSVRQAARELGEAGLVEHVPSEGHYPIAGWRRRG